MDKGGKIYSGDNNVYPLLPPKVAHGINMKSCLSKDFEKWQALQMQDKVFLIVLKGEIVNLWTMDENP